MIAGPENLETRQVEAAREVRRLGQFRETLGPKFGVKCSHSLRKQPTFGRASWEI